MGGGGGGRRAVRYADGRPKGVAPGGNSKGATGNSLMGEGGKDNPYGV